jgi:hypothetical protein
MHIFSHPKSRDHGKDAEGHNLPLPGNIYCEGKNADPDGSETKPKEVHARNDRVEDEKRDDEEEPVPRSKAQEKRKQLLHASTLQVADARVSGFHYGRLMMPDGRPLSGTPAQSRTCVCSRNGERFTFKAPRPRIATGAYAILAILRNQGCNPCTHCSIP